MKIQKVLFTKGTTGFFFDDQTAIKNGASMDGFIYKGKVLTDGFEQIRQAGECVSVLLILENGQVAQGDCAAVQYSGAGGRDPLFLADRYIPFMEKHLRPLLEGLELDSFRKLAEKFDSLLIEGKPLHTAIRYGISQALLDAIAKAENKLMAEVVAEDYQIPLIPERVPIFAQSGDDRYNNVDKMILKKADVLPHALINHVDSKLGRNGELLSEYVGWLAKRITSLRVDSIYKPCLHIDVYGTIGLIFDNSATKVASYLKSLETPANGFELYIEGPVDVGHRERQVDALAAITKELNRIGSTVKIVADEWCNTKEDVILFTDAKSCHMVQIKTPDLGSIHNTVESVLYCRKNGMEAYQGGTCNETDLSAKACLHVAIAARAERLLAKPGMGFDEGYMIVNNEMERVLAVLKAKG
ncbi:MAG: methylaspartate ammonia-lyase [Holophagaceae bacterium]|nr:methylaspartate ammonia-lyase [Holophagaceae bacterium]